jgi:transcriptional regulator with XRE-family HTH domain
MAGMLTDHPLKRWRQQHQLTQAQLGRQCGMKQNAISRYERGERTPREDELIHLLDATGLPVEALVLPARFLIQHPDFLNRQGRPKGSTRRKPDA